MEVHDDVNGKWKPFYPCVIDFFSYRGFTPDDTPVDELLKRDKVYGFYIIPAGLSEPAKAFQLVSVASGKLRARQEHH